MIRPDCLCSADPATSRELDRSVALVKMISFGVPSTYVLSDFGRASLFPSPLASSAAWTLACAASQEQFRTSGCTLTCETGVSGESAGGGDPVTTVAPCTRAW